MPSAKPIPVIRDTKDLETVLYRIFNELNLDEFSPMFKDALVTTFSQDGAPDIYRGIHIMWPHGAHATIAFVMYDGKEAWDVATRRASHPGQSG